MSHDVSLSAAARHVCALSVGGTVKVATSSDAGDLCVHVAEPARSIGGELA